MIVSIGMWIIPALVSVLSICWLIFKKPDGGNFPAIGAMLDIITVLIINLVAWLIWALFFK